MADRRVGGGGDHANLHCLLVLVFGIISGSNTCYLIVSLDLRHRKNFGLTTMYLFQSINIRVSIGMPRSPE